MQFLNILLYRNLQIYYTCILIKVRLIRILLLTSGYPIFHPGRNLLINQSIIQISRRMNFYTFKLNLVDKWMSKHLILH